MEDVLDRARHGPLKLIYEDAQILAFDKPAGLAVQGGSGVEDSLETMLAAYAKPGKPAKLVHRLDRETSGVIIVARNRTSAAALSKSFERGEAIKTYLAIVCASAPPAPCGVIDEPLKRVTHKGVDLMRLARPDETGAQAARTRYRTLASSKDCALVALMPETGRMHQLRAHLAMLGAPIAGDGKYGGLFALGRVKIPGLMLHAFTLAIAHPKGAMLDLRAEPPEAFCRTAAALGLGALAGLEGPQ
jgi:tRNA pseudouridine32 synthase/23S rRNA pseudouridine746 synthase